MNLDQLKKQREKLAGVAKKLKDKESKSSNVDERFFRPKKDSAGNISCIIRFLPQIDFDKTPYVEKHGHFINASGKTFGCACTEIDEKGSCPVCEKSKPYWDEYWSVRNQHGKEHPGCKEALKGANNFTRNTQTVTNILVVQNPAEPETEGKVFLYNMGKVVLSKYKQKLFPEDELDEMVLIHDPFAGRNFKLSGKTKVVDENTSFIEYDDSYFYDRETPVSEDDEKLMQILNETYDLDKFLKESKPDKEDIKKRFNEFKKFLGIKDEEQKIEERDEYSVESKTKDSIIVDVEDDDLELENIEEIEDDEFDSLFDD